MREYGRSQTEGAPEGAPPGSSSRNDLFPANLGNFVRFGLTVDLTAILCERLIPGVRAYLPLGHDDFVQLCICLLAALIAAEYVEFGRGIAIAIKRAFADFFRSRGKGLH